MKALEWLLVFFVTLILVLCAVEFYGEDEE